MDEAFPGLCRAVSLWGGPAASTLTSNRCFIIHTGVLTKRWILLYLLAALVNNHGYCHFNLLVFLTVVCWSSLFLCWLIRQPASLTLHLLTITAFTSFQGCEGIPAAKVVCSRQCSTGIWLSFLGRGRFGTERLSCCKWLRLKPCLGRRNGDKTRG